MTEDNTPQNKSYLYCMISHALEMGYEVKLNSRKAKLMFYDKMPALVYAETVRNPRFYLHQFSNVGLIDDGSGIIGGTYNINNKDLSCTIEFVKDDEPEN